MVQIRLNMITLLMAVAFAKTAVCTYTDDVNKTSCHDACVAATNSRQDWLNGAQSLGGDVNAQQTRWATAPAGKLRTAANNQDNDCNQYLVNISSVEREGLELQPGMCQTYLMHIPF